jgi:hypothetical protein
MSVPTTAVEGQKFTLSREVLGTTRQYELVVGPACANKTGGHWHCMSHDLDFQNQLEKDCHLDYPGKHELCWMCHEHGPEVP